MKHHPLIPALLLSLGLTACGGGGGGTSTAPGTQPSPAPLPTPTPTPVPTPTPTPTDACTNYEGEQTLAEIQAKGFVRLNDGTCRLERNHEALSTSGFDLARMKGYTGQGITVAVFDTGFRDHQEYSGRVLWGAKYIDLNKDAKLQDGEAILGDWDANSVEVYHGPAVASVVAGKTLGAAMSATLVFAAEGTPNYIHGEEFAIAHEDLIKNKSISIINNSNGMGEGGVLYWSALQGTTNHDPYGFMNTLVYSPSVVIFGAGNSGLDFSDTLDRYFKDMATYGLEAVTPFNDPREAENLLYVGSFDRAKNELALYSNYPGHRKAVQDRFLVTGDYRTETASHEAFDAYSYGEGTSLAAPMASGAMAILMSVNPRLTAIEAAQILLDTAKRPASLGYGQTCTVKTDLGTFTSDCGAMKFGRGIMDVMAAIEDAKRR